MQGTVSGLVASYGYVVLFFLVGLESLGLPLPGETALVTAAAFAALGHLSIYGVVTTAVAAAVIGDNGGYWIGRKGGIAPRPSSLAASSRCCAPGQPCSRERHGCRMAVSCSTMRSARCVGPGVSARSATCSAAIYRGSSTIWVRPAWQGPSSSP